MADTAFSRTPFITLERLRDDREEALRIAPPWARSATVVAPDLPLEDDAVLTRIGTLKALPLLLPVPSAAILFELTRYGNSITTNRNSTAGGRWYPKLTFSEHPEDTMPVSRIIMDARSHESVQVGSDPGDLRPSLLSKQGAGKPIKDAREVAIRHAVALATPGVDGAAYEKNLRSLFAFHDDLLLAVEDY